MSEKKRTRSPRKHYSKNFIGKKYNRWIVLEEVNTKSTRAYLCLCECGNKSEVLQQNLINGKSKSCGCYGKEIRVVSNTKHGKRNTRLYSIWSNMKTRCYNKNFKDKIYYSSKGINICDEWIDDFMNFYNWAMNNGYKDNLSIDRIDNNGNYEPENCRWATYQEQSLNVGIKKNNKTGYRNISFSKKENKYLFQIVYNKKGYKKRFKELKDAVNFRNKFIKNNNLPHKIQEYIND